MKFRAVKHLLKRAAILGAVAFSVPAIMSACSFWFEGSPISQGVDEFAKGVSTVVAESDIVESAEDFAETVRLMADNLAHENDAEFVRAKVARVVDGDTIVVELDREEVKVRLIGVNTPESVASEEYLERTGKENTQEGKDASDFTKEILKDHPYVYLEADEEATDKYGRSLYYVWLEKPTGLSSSERISDIEDKMLNGILLKEGYAEVSIFKPNVKYADEFAVIYNRETDEYELDR